MNLTQKAQNLIRDNMTLDDALPTRMPVYVNSMAYMFGILAICSFVLVVTTGIILAIFGPTWYHISPEGKYINAMHFWSVQMFFFSMLCHLTTKFFMSAWRDKRWLTWAFGLITFGLAAFTGLTGYLAQTNWDAQWIAVQAKDAMNAIGIGSFFNTMNTGQILTIHTAVLPACIVVLVSIHLILVRRDGPVKPMERVEGVPDYDAQSGEEA